MVVTHGLWLIQKLYAESLDIMVSNSIRIGDVSLTLFLQAARVCLMTIIVL